MLHVVALSRISILSSWARHSPTHLVVPSAVGLNNKCKSAKFVVYTTQRGTWCISMQVNNKSKARVLEGVKRAKGGHIC